MILADAVAKRIVDANAGDTWRAVQVKGKRRSGSRTKRIDPSKVLNSEEREDFLAAVARRLPHYCYNFLRRAWEPIVMEIF